MNTSHATLDKITDGYYDALAPDGRNIGTVVDRCTGSNRWYAITPENVMHNPDTAPHYGIAETAQRAADILHDRDRGVGSK